MFCLHIPEIEHDDLPVQRKWEKEIGAKTDSLAEELFSATINGDSHDVLIARFIKETEDIGRNPVRKVGATKDIPRTEIATRVLRAYCMKCFESTTVNESRSRLIETLLAIVQAEKKVAFECGKAAGTQEGHRSGVSIGKHLGEVLSDRTRSRAQYNRFGHRVG